MGLPCRTEVRRRGARRHRRNGGPEVGPRCRRVFAGEGSRQAIDPTPTPTRMSCRQLDLAAWVRPVVSSGVRDTRAVQRRNAGRLSPFAVEDRVVVGMPDP
jgi:hypothetical protein